MISNEIREKIKERERSMARGRQQQIKQMWFNPQDEENFRRIAEQFEREGENVKQDNPRSTEPYSHTKVMRLLMERYLTP